MRNLLLGATAALALSTPALAQLDPAALRDAALKDEIAWDITEGLTTEVGPRLAGTEAETRAFLEAGRDLQVASINADGTPHLVTMWYELEGDDLCFWTYAKSQKVVNLRRDPRLTVLVATGEVYEELRGVSIVGHAELVETFLLLALASPGLPQLLGRVRDEAAETAAEGRSGASDQDFGQAIQEVFAGHGGVPRSPISGNKAT